MVTVTHPPSRAPKALKPRQALLKYLRDMRAPINAMIKAWGGPSGASEDVSANWDALWRAANNIKMKADGLATFAAQQARLARERAHPANQPETPVDPEGGE
jgi:hypothetical protein